MVLGRIETIAPKFFNVTQNETERMIRLVNDLMKLSKMDSKDYRFSKEWVEFSIYFNKIIDRFEMTKAEKCYLHLEFFRSAIIG